MPKTHAVKNVASAKSAASQLTAPGTPGSLAYKIGPQDVLEISVFKVPELSTSVQVADTGTINLALIGDINAAGRTAQEIERDLVKRLGTKYLQRPQVRVFVKEYNSQRITVEGAVKKPGVFPYRGRATLLQTIAMAEGLDVVSDTNVVIFRTLNGKRAAARFDISDIRSGKTADPPIESGDVVVVATNTFKETFQNVIKAIPLAGVFALL
ncbi:MAG: polysaccharide biosynthesis/export family protein [Hyphomicrobiaceae bacterium]